MRERETYTFGETEGETERGQSYSECSSSLSQLSELGESELRNCPREVEVREEKGELAQ